MMGWSPRCYTQSFIEIGSPVQEKKMFDAFFTILGPDGHLGHVTSIMLMDFHFLASESLHIKCG